MNNSIAFKSIVFIVMLNLSSPALSILPPITIPPPHCESCPPPCESCSGYQRGPDPTVEALEARRGPFSVDSITVPEYVEGFRGGTIYYPSQVKDTIGAIAMVTGYYSYQDRVRWWGPRLASHGFVVINIDTF